MRVRQCTDEEIRITMGDVAEPYLVPNTPNHQRYISTNLLDPTAEIEAARNRSDKCRYTDFWQTPRKGSHGHHRM